MARYIEFYGRGIAFPVRIDPNMGGFKITDGNRDHTSVGLAYMADRWTIQESVDYDENHVAEAIAHILLTRQYEHDTLPEFGSRIQNILFEPNNMQTAIEFETWAEEATKRWEYRVSLIPPQDFVWRAQSLEIDEGVLKVKLTPTFIMQNTISNLVSPMTSAVSARLAEYRSAFLDENNHDWCSRYLSYPAYEYQQKSFIRPRIPKPIKKAYDDIFYTVKNADTWLLMSWELYQDIRFWWVCVDSFIEDKGLDGESRDYMDCVGNPLAGEVIRVPSRRRLLMEISS